MESLTRPVYVALDALQIPYDSYEHPPVFTSEDVEAHWRHIPATPVKNLFLRNKKGNREDLGIAGVDKRVDLQQLVKSIGGDRLGFGSTARLMPTLVLTP